MTAIEKRRFVWNAETHPALPVWTTARLARGWQQVADSAPVELADGSLEIEFFRSIEVDGAVEPLPA